MIWGRQPCKSRQNVMGSTPAITFMHMQSHLYCLFAGSVSRSTSLCVHGCAQTNAHVKVNKSDCNHMDTDVQQTRAMYHGVVAIDNKRNNALRYMGGEMTSMGNNYSGSAKALHIGGDRNFASQILLLWECTMLQWDVAAYNSVPCY